MRDADEIKSQFLSVISHEIRTPLNVILGTINLLAETALTDEQREYVTQAKVACDHLLYLVNDILDFSKLESGIATAEYSHFSLEALALSTFRQFASAAAAKNVCLVFHPVAPAVPDVYADAGRIRQIILNFVSNAVKFTTKGHVSLQVDVVPAETGHTICRITVEDTGEGIPYEWQPRVFSPFMQVPRISSAFGGTGLGLAICKKLSELMGGRVGFESTPGKGSRFWAEFPVRLSPEPPLAPATAKQASPAGLNPDSGKALVWTTCRAECNAIKLSFDAAGLICEVPASASQTLLKLRELRSATKGWCGVVVDEMLISMDQSISDDLKELSKTLPVVLVGFASPSDLQVDNIAYYMRPVDIRTLTWRIQGKAHLASSQASRAVETHEQMVGADTSKPCGGLIRVLLVEDNHVNQFVTARMLEKLGCTVDVAANGQEALHALGGKDYDVLFVDLQMPVMDGWKLAQFLKTYPRQSVRETPLVALTAAVSERDRDRAIAAGFQRFLPKPVDIADVRVILKWISEGRCVRCSRRKECAPPVAAPIVY